MGTWAQLPTIEAHDADAGEPVTSDHTARRHASPSARRGRRLVTLLLCTPSLWGFIALALGGSLWIPSLMRELTSHALPAMALAALWAVRTRRYVPALLNAAALALCLIILVGPRASHAPHTPGHGPDKTIRVLQLNALTSNPNGDLVQDAISDPALDIISLIECPVKLSRAIRADEVLTNLHRVTATRNPPFTQWVLLLSKWPMDPWDSEAAATPGLVGAAVHCPSGPVGVVALHAASPWAPDRWRVGNATIEGAARIAAEMREAGLPVIVVGDLNATPLGTRTSRLRDAGLKRSKPVLAPAGTFPSWLPWPFRIAIDDAMVSEEFRVRHWRPFALPGSDHLGLSMELVVSGR